MRTVPALLALVLAGVVPAAARAETARTTASLKSHDGDMAGRLGYVGTGPFSPSLTVEMRAAAGHDEALLGPLATFYRIQPEILFGFRPLPRLELFGGGGVGSAYVVPDPAILGARAIPAGPAVTLSGALGARFPWERVPLSAVARAQSVCGYGAAVTLDLALNLAEMR
jgi:hypothetical protein